MNKKKLFFKICLVVFCLYLFPNNLFAKDENFVNKFEKRVTSEMDYVPGEIIVKYKTNKVNFKDGSGLAKVEEIKSRLALEEKDKFNNLNIEVLKTKNSVKETIEELKKDTNVEYAEPNYLRYPAEINTNDTNRGLLWGLDNTGQTVDGVLGTVDKDIDAPSAWTLSEGDGVIVAVIDTGVAYNHPDLINNMWNGSSCLDENGNALGSCYHGYDFEDNDKIPLPTTSTHGTHVAGIIAAEKNNSKGVIGVAPKVKIMALKSNLSVTENVEAIDFAIQNGAKVINASYVGPSYSTAEYDAINRFKTAGGIFVAAAGNYATNNDSSPYYPASYDLDNIISVAATDQNDNLASFSNYGATSVDVAAPGVNIYSTVSSKTTTMSQNFEGVVVPNIPVGWSKTGNWGTYNIGTDWGKVLYGDLSYPYANNANYTIESPTYDLSSTQSSISFWTACDTPLSSSSWKDYMALEYSADAGSNYTQVSRWDESSLSSSTQHLTFSIPAAFSTSNFKFRFRWVTDSSDNSHDGCRIDDITIDKFTDGSDEQYGFLDGTSMATPYVVGAVADLIYKYPSENIVNIKNILINTGADPLNSLNGKTVFGKRLNLYRALLSNETYPAGSVFRFWSNQNKHHFYTISKDERDMVAAIYDENAWKYEGIAYTAFTEPGENRIPVYRFWSNRNRAHFYTASEVEKDSVINIYASDPDGWSYESIGFYVYDKGYTGPSKPVYRFWSDQNRGHFYTASESEKDTVIDIYTDYQWLYEGVAFRVAADEISSM